MALSVATVVQAVPAYRGAIKAVQPDGKTITFFLHGDEYGHTCVSSDGYRLLQDREGAYRYARLSDSSTLTIDNSPLAHDPKERDFVERTFVKGLKKLNNFTTSTIRKTPSPVSEAPTTGRRSRFQIGNFPTIGKGKCLVLLVEFTDKKFSLDQTYHDRLLNESGFSENGATGCARDYYMSQSMNLFEPHFDVIGPITMSHGVAYYGGDDTWSGKDVNVGKMISEACQKAHDEHEVDFSQYDGDNDGKVDMVYVIYAGYGQHAGGGDNTIWPHKFQLSGFNINLQLNGKTVDTYACSSELFGNSGVQSSGIGTICHEFGHVLGLADHYNTGDGTAYMLGSYDIMDYGAYNNDGNTPPSYNAFERMSLGWMTPDTLSAKGDGLTLENIAESNKAYVIGTSNPNEFYLLENRQQSGWDRYLPAGGMMITHVDYNASAWTNNQVNDDASHPRFYLVPADNEAGYNAKLNKDTESQDLYPNATNNRFTDGSVPAAKPYTGEALDRWVTDIAEDGETVSFNFMANHLDVPTAISAKLLSDNSFVASWEASPKAGAYTLNLYKLALKSEQEYAIREGFARMTEGTPDAPASSNIADRLDDYLYEKGWKGSNVYQAGGWCQIGTNGKGGSITTPALNLRRFDGEFAVAVTVKSPVGKSPVFSVTANGQEGKTRITSNQRTFLFKFSGGISQTPITLSTNTERALIDSIAIVRGDRGDELFANAKEVTVTGTPDVQEGDSVEDRDFLHTDTLTINDITDLNYTFDKLEADTYYAFAVKAVGDNAESAFSNEVIVYTNLASAIQTPNILYEAEEEIFTLGGLRISKADKPGIYIIRKGRSVKKIVKK